MNLLPRTLLARVMLLIALLLAAGQFAALKLFDYFESEPRAMSAALQAITVVNYTRASLLAAHENRRLALLSELSGREGVRIYAADMLEEIEPLPNDLLIRLIATKIRERLGKDTLVVMNHFGIPGLWVSFSLGQDDYWVVIPRIQVDRPFPWQWLGWGALVIMLSLLGAYLIASNIHHPLRLLVKAAGRLSSGEYPPPLPEEGAHELREVSRTFNEMTEALVRLDNERTLLLAGISHDLRTPLARLRLSVEMLPDEHCASLKTGMIQDIGDMDSIIHQFLDFVRGIEGEPTQMMDLNALLGSIADRHIRAGRKLNLSLGPTHLIPLRPLAMQRLLGNLVDNAFAYGGGEVTLTTRITAGNIILSVLDNGPGIPASQMERLLRPFERLDTARGNKSGSGLGLAISDRIAKLHKGQLTLLNRPQGGLEARLTLPIQPQVTVQTKQAFRVNAPPPRQ
ncbi:HAMP domain-containing protein [Methylobacillus gramineus]|uniref:sensor histidine kinase n=1 Tax=Methylobacillus gramineus TaxID=755169 RepID=UPI001CFFC526|nr:sensor histidine kinase [Methylobacillus gramineus]MCB5185038.1 HAMP domain-containing protein [Methylobacillus gramineus]